jgi:adenine phosphoribosyltransferase
MEHIKRKIRTIPHFPKQGIMFRDITTLLQDGQGLKDVVSEFVNRYEDANVDVVAGIDARGFIIGGVIAHELGVGFVPLRKEGKLPYKTVCVTYDLEYGTDTIEIHCDAIKNGENVLLVDDLLATGGTSLGAAQLIEKLGGKIVEIAFIIDLPEVGGRKRLEDAGYNVFSLVEFKGE